MQIQRRPRKLRCPKKESLESLIMDTANLQASVQNVRVICLFCTDYGLAICFSTQYGWCVAKEGLIGKSFRDAMKPGNWLSVPLCPAISGSEDAFKVANWMVLGCKETSPPFNLFCRNKSSVVAVIEAMAYDNLRRVQNDFGSKFLILGTCMGQVWMPGAIEERRQDPAKMVEIYCPPRCACGGAYRSYEDPNSEVPVDHRRRDSDTTIDEFLASEDSEFQLQESLQEAPPSLKTEVSFEEDLSARISQDRTGRSPGPTQRFHFFLVLPKALPERLSKEEDSCLRPR
ncbi:hypothetical protein L596_013555 [Steinernema carpocapsae]|uniref:Uncharacterized protein n=1 Tax=Steinernema carpocapsae TaxID=34508 RepID=A0A4V6A548_STECR|nr:hypothetical protein L596_013555 [Steinernema carpocapsae]